MSDYDPLPLPTSTSQERLEALKNVKPLLEMGGVAGVIFGSGTAGGDGVLALLRLAEYVTLGHDYLDTHPTPEQIEIEEQEENDDNRID